ncbi:MAG: protein TolB [Wolbachia endosymbiont of Meromenopon meropis]|nr:protein TolB [Wolbachia endosymbiont of Meromenopon meropis]
MKILTHLILFSFLSFAYFAKAVLYVDIRENTVAKIDLVVFKCACKTELGSKLNENITKIIEADLSDSGFFYIERIIEDEITMQKSIKVDILATVSLIEISDKALELSLHLFDTFTKSELFTHSVIFLRKDWRKIAHFISDLIYVRLTGENGYFNTKIAYIAEEKDNNDKFMRRIAIMNQDGSDIKYLTNGDKFVSSPRFVPNNNSIIYILYLDDKSYLISKNLKDNTESIINIFNGVISAPRFSSDGKFLLISYSFNGETNIFCLDLNSKNTRKITRSSAISTSASFSPDQKYMVFSSDISGSQQLYVIDFAKKNKKPERISFGNGKYITSVWSPNGDLIAFIKVKLGKFYIGVMKPDGKEERILSEGYKIESPTWLPNSRGIIFTKMESSSNSKIYLLNLVKMNQRIISTPTNAYLPDWSSYLPLIE